MLLVARGCAIIGSIVACLITHRFLAKTDHALSCSKRRERMTLGRHDVTDAGLTS